MSNLAVMATVKTKSNNTAKARRGANLPASNSIYRYQAPNKYGAIIMPTGSFCLLPKHIIEEVLVSFYNLLEDDGIIVIDLLLPSDFISGQTETVAYELDSETGILFTISHQNIDWVSQKVSYIHRYELLKNGLIQQTEISNFILYWYGVSEFEMMLKHAGFSEINHVFSYGNSNQKSLITFMATKM